MPNAEDPTAIAENPGDLRIVRHGVAQILDQRIERRPAPQGADVLANQRLISEGPNCGVAGVFGAHPGIAALVRFELQMRADFSLEVVLTLVPCRPLAPPAHVAPP